jgi:hypothetical protein
VVLGEGAIEFYLQQSRVFLGLVQFLLQGLSVDYYVAVPLKQIKL